MAFRPKHFFPVAQRVYLFIYLHDILVAVAVLYLFSSDRGGGKERKKVDEWSLLYFFLEKIVSFPILPQVPLPLQVSFTVNRSPNRNVFSFLLLYLVSK